MPLDIAMIKYKRSSHLRSVLKGISWRIIATIDTVAVVLFITCLTGNCSLDNAITIGASEFLLKLLIYYVHERLWLNYLGKQASKRAELIKKTITWRIVATLITFSVSGIVLKSFNEIALYIALTELFTKFVLYYFHEKLWLMLPLGKIRNFFLNKSKK